MRLRQIRLHLLTVACDFAKSATDNYLQTVRQTRGPSFRFASFFPAPPQVERFSIKSRSEQQIRFTKNQLKVQSDAGSEPVRSFGCCSFAEAAAKRPRQRDPCRAALRLSLRRQSTFAARLRANHFAAAVSVALLSPQVINYFPIT